MSVADKRAALELHNLNREDREWVLGRLPAAEQARVRPLLAELDEMNVRFDLESDVSGIDGAADAQNIRTAADARTSAVDRRTSPAAVAAASEPSAHAFIRNASGEDVARVLADEPAWLVGAVLALDEWPWSASVRHALERSGSVPVLRNGAPLPPALCATLLPLVAQRLRGPTASRPNGPINGHRASVNGIGIWHRLWPRVKQWLP